MAAMAAQLRVVSIVAAALPVWLLLIGAPAFGLLRDGALFGPPQTAIAILAGIGLLTGLAIGAVANPRWRIRLAAIGLFMGAAMLLAPTRWTLFAGDVALDPSGGGLLVTGLLVLGVALADRHLPSLVLGGGAVAALACLGAAAMAFVIARPVPSAPFQTSFAAGPNIYQFVFDGMSARVFDPASASEGWNGFTAYPENRTNFAATDGSLPSMFTGSHFTGGWFRAFQDAARTGGYRAALRDAGYQVSLYVPDRNRFWWFDKASHVVTAQDMARAAHDPLGVRTLFQIGVAHATPPSLKKQAVLATRRAWKWSNYNRYKQDTGLIDRFISDEAKRPARGQYVYLHIMLPHPPYKLDANCRPAKTGYVAQSECMVRLAERLTGRLRALGRLDGSLVIVQGDHGFHASESDLPDVREPIPGPVRKRLDALGDSYDADDLMQRSHGLLLIHRPGAPDAPLAVSGEESQLVDIAPTVAETASLGPWRGVGRSLLRDNAAPRDWHYFAGLTSKTGLFRRRLGRDTEDGRLGHVVRDASGRWRVMPDVIATPSGEIFGR